MAIIDAKRVTVIGLKNDKDKILKSLQSLGAVEISENNYEQADKIETNDEVIELEKKLADVDFAGKQVLLLSLYTDFAFPQKM